MLFLAGNVHADALWYALENGSKVELTNGSATELTGRIALLGCGNDQVVDTKSSKRPFPFHAVKFDNTPDVLEAQIHDPQSAEIHLFGGPGVGVSHRPSMIAQRDGKVDNFEWYLQQKLEQDYGNEALIFRRKLELDKKKDNKISFHDQQQACPDTVKLSLVIKDTYATYKSKLITTSTGEQIMTADPEGRWKEETVGSVTLIATAIPGSEEKVHSRFVERTIYVDKLEKPRPIPQDNATNATLTQPAPVKSQRIRPRIKLNSQPNSKIENNESE